MPRALRLSPLKASPYGLTQGDPFTAKDGRHDVSQGGTHGTHEIERRVDRGDDGWARRRMAGGTGAGACPLTDARSRGASRQRGASRALRAMAEGFQDGGKMGARGTRQQGQLDARHAPESARGHDADQ